VSKTDNNKDTRQDNQQSDISYPFYPF